MSSESLQNLEVWKVATPQFPFPDVSDDELQKAFHRQTVANLVISNSC